MENIGVLIGILSGIIAIIGYFKPWKQKPTEEREHLKIQFDMNKALSIKIQHQLENHININNAEQSLMLQGMTFGKYLEFVKNNHQAYLNDDLRKVIDDPKLTKPNIDSMTKSLEQQFLNLQQTHNLLLTLS